MLKIKEEEEKGRKIFRVTLIKLKRKRDRRERAREGVEREREESERPDVQGECCRKRKKNSLYFQSPLRIEPGTSVSASDHSNPKPPPLPFTQVTC